ncbi:MAG TPA: M48 family metalloprotease [Bryobacteraceae bacterium]
MRLHLGIALLVAWTLNGQAIGQGVNFYSIQKESALGEQLARAYRDAHSPLDSAMVRDYVEQVGQRLMRALPQGSPFLPYHFEVTADSTGTFLEPTAFPGGAIFIPAGLILETRDEAEFAGTLAHAMAHVLGRHYTREETKSAIAQMAAGPLRSVPVAAGLDRSIDATLLQFHSSLESEADRIAVGLTSTAGYDPRGVERFIAREQSDTGQSNLPPRDARVLAIEQAVQALPRQNAPSPDFTRIQDEVRRLMNQ